MPPDVKVWVSYGSGNGFFWRRFVRLSVVGEVDFLRKLRAAVENSSKRTWGISHAKSQKGQHFSIIFRMV